MISMLRPAVIALTVLLLAACSHDKEGVELVAPFDGGGSLGRVTAVWSKSGKDRAFAGGVRLKESEVRFQYRVDVRSRYRDKLFVEVGNFQLVDANGLALGSDTTTTSCILPDGTLQGILSGEVWLPRRLGERVKAFRVAHLAVPLGDRERKQYREWLLRGRPDGGGEVDAKIATYAAAPPCTAR
jgi:hypothetical protein